MERTVSNEDLPRLGHLKDNNNKLVYEHSEKARNVAPLGDTV